MSVVVEGERPPSSTLGRVLRWVALVIGVGAGVGFLIGAVTYIDLSADLPAFETIDEYRPKVVTRVFAQDGQLIGEFYRERRVVVPYSRIPRRLVQAVLSSEDDRFFDHEGIDYMGILRAAIANVKAGRVVQGGSTITQQVAKSLLVSAEGYESGTAKKLSRKVKEAILARRLEKTLSKEEILTLYLNQIFLGNHSYGVQVAAENYFRKNVGDLNLAEIALLAGLPQAPSRYSPFRHPQRARARREYVLRRMAEEGFISAAELEEAESTPITVYDARDVSRAITPYFTEHVRRQLVETYGETKVLDEGLEVWTTVDVEAYRGAEDSTYKNLRMVDKRQGYRGALMRLESAGAQKKFLEAYGKELLRRERLEKLEHGELYVGVVTKINRKKKNYQLRIGPHSAVLPLAAARWARDVNPQAWFEGALLRNLPKSIEKGDVLLVRTTTRKEIKKDKYAWQFLDSIPKGKNAPTIVALEQEPDLEAALLSVDVDSGYVLAMIGGYSYDRSEFNRAVQACRQPGSSFKPVVYAAALDLLGWTASNTVLDAPLTFDDPEAQRRWKPNNFEQRFLGEVTLRTALQHSMNVPAIKVLHAVGLIEAAAYAARLGISSELPLELGMALGQGCVLMADLVEVYRLFASYGVRSKRRFITRVVDRDGNVLMDDAHFRDPWIAPERRVALALAAVESPPEPVIDRHVGYLITKMMRNVVMGGTGVMAQKLGVPVAGKTGTTNDSFDAWFVGYTTDIVTAAWVGYDDYVMPMGRYEQGGRAALPVWLDYMKRALKGGKSPEFPPPPGIVFVRIDPKTGLRARGSTEGAVTEAFLEGKQPEEFVVEGGAARPDELFMEDNF